MNEEVPIAPFAAGEEFGFLDLLITLAENIKLLIFGSLAVGLCALGISFLLPQTFQSVAILQAEQSTDGVMATAASVMTTAAVLDPVIASLGLAKDGTVEAARLKLRDQIKTAVGRTDKLLTLTVSAGSAQEAQAIANAVLQQTYLESRPKGAVLARLETQLTEAKTRLKNAQEAAAGLLKRLEANGSGAGAGVELARGYAELLNASGAAQGQISALEPKLNVLSAAQLVQSPTLPQKASQPKKGLITVGATLAAGLLLLLFVFMRQALRNTTVSETTAAKMARIRRSLSWR